MQLKILILIIGVTALISEFKTGTNIEIDFRHQSHILFSSNVPGRSLTRTLSFGYTFRDIPEVAVAINYYDYQAGLPFGCSIEVISTTRTDFTFKATEYTGKTIYCLFIGWHAFNDESIEMINFKLEQPTMIIGLNTISKTRIFANTGILILSGFQYSKDPDFYAEIIDVTDTDFVVQLTDPTSCLTWVSYLAVLGHEQNMWSQGLQQIVPIIRPDYTTYDHNLVFPDNWSFVVKFAIMGLTGFHEWPTNNQRLFFKWRLNENSLDYRVGQWADTVVYEARFQILIYKFLEFEQSCVNKYI